MEVKVIFGASAYAVIRDGATTLDVQLKPGRGVAKSLRETVEDLRLKLAQDLARTNLIEAAIPHFETEKGGIRT